MEQNRYGERVSFLSLHLTSESLSLAIFLSTLSYHSFLSFHLTFSISLFPCFFLGPFMPFFSNFSGQSCLHFFASLSNLNRFSSDSFFVFFVLAVLTLYQHFIWLTWTTHILPILNFTKHLLKPSLHWNINSQTHHWHLLSWFIKTLNLIHFNHFQLNSLIKHIFTDTSSDFTITLPMFIDIPILRVKLKANKNKSQQILACRYWLYCQMKK